MRKFKEKMRRNPRLFVLGIVIGLVMLSIALASIPPAGRTTDDTALYQSVSEIRIPREPAPNFDGEVARLSQLQPQYREAPTSRALGDPRLSQPLRRVERRRYRPSSYNSNGSR